MEAKKLEVIGKIKFETDLSEFCKEEGFTNLSKDDLRALATKLGKNGEPVSKDLRGEIIEAVTNGMGYTPFLTEDEFNKGDSLSAEALLIVEILEQMPYRSDFSVAIKENKDDKYNYEFKLTTDIDYIPYKEFLKNLTNSNIGLWDKIDDINKNYDISNLGKYEGYVHKDSSLYTLFEEVKAKHNGSNELFRNIDDKVTIRQDYDFFSKNADQIIKNIKQLLNDDYDDWKEEICSESTERLVNGDLELRNTYSRFTIGLYNMDNLYFKVLDMLADNIIKDKNRQLEAENDEIDR